MIGVNPSRPLCHIWDVMLVWRKGLLTELSLCYIIVYFYNGHSGTSSSDRSVDWIGLSLILFDLALYREP